MEDKLILKYETNEPIEIYSFCNSLIAFQEEYKSITNESSKLLIKEIRKGSIEVELLAIATATILPILANMNTIFQFLDYIKATVEWLSGRAKEPEETKFTIKDLQNIRDILTPVAQSLSETSRLSLSAPGYESDIQIEKKTVEEINRNIRRKELNERIYPTYLIPDRKQTKVLFYWYQTRFDDKEINAGNKGLVSSIDRNPKKVIFADDASETKHQMTTTNPVLGKDWQEVGYFVDLEIIVHEDKIVAYKILKNYPDDSIID